MKAYGGVDVVVYSHIFLTLALVEGEQSASRPGRFTPEERAPGIHWIGGWANPRAGLELRLFSRPARSQSLSRILSD
jgi:hypothetical protein